MGFPMFAQFVTVSHAYTHVVEYGTPVEIFGLQISSGDLLFADCHGVISIPPGIAEDVVRVAGEIRWIAVEKVPHGPAWCYVLLTVPSTAGAVLVGRTLMAIRRGTFLPSAQEADAEKRRPLA